MEKKFFIQHNEEESKLVERLQTDINHVCKHKFKYSFRDSIKPFFVCSINVKSCSFSK